MATKINITIIVVTVPLLLWSVLVHGPAMMLTGSLAHRFATDNLQILFKF